MKEIPFFCVFEGVDGCGSTTHSKLLKVFLTNLGFKVYLTREPSNSEIGVLLRKFLSDNSIPPITDALLFAADRNYHYHIEIKKKLEEGYIVISDRYLESSIVYQSLQIPEISVEWVAEINRFVGKPDLTIVLDIDPKISMERKRGELLEKFENISFLTKVRQLYLERAKNEGYEVINTNDIIELVQEKIQQIVLKKLESLGVDIQAK
ncbi:MAG: dTMP kinase [Promethearchaeota archaeon]